MIVNAPIVRSSNVGAVRVMVTSPAVRVSMEALLPDGPAEVEDVPPGAIETVAVPQFTSSILRDFKACIAEVAYPDAVMLNA